MSESKRPVFLTVLCILSFVFSGLAIFGVLAATLFVGGAAAMSSTLSESVGNAEAAEASAQIGSAAGLGMGYLIISLALIIVGLIGVILMWKLQKKGFYIYTAAAVVGFILPMIVFGMPFSLFSLIITGGFIVMYGLNLKAMS